MANKNVHPIFKDILNDIIKQPEPTVMVLSIKKWKHTDKYDCPGCGKKIGNDTKYLCTPCNIKIKPVINF